MVHFNWVSLVVFGLPDQGNERMLFLIGTYEDALMSQQH